MSKQRKCWACGKLHEYCSICGQTHGWRYVADTIECYTIYMTVEDYRAGVLTKKQAAEALSSKCNITTESDTTWLLPHIEKVVREIIGDKEKSVKTKKEVVSKATEE